MAAGPRSRHEGEQLTTKSRRPRAIALAMVQLLVAGAFVAFTASTAQAQEPTGATATKDCPQRLSDDPYTIGDTVDVHCHLRERRWFPATVTALFETGPVRR